MLGLARQSIFTCEYNCVYNPSFSGVPPPRQKSRACTGAKSIPSTQFVVFKSHFPLKEARQLLREIAGAQPGAEKALAERRYHGMAETNDTVKLRVVSPSLESPTDGQRRRQETRHVPPDEEVEGHSGLLP